jgi:hypothetical protein
MAGIAHSHRHRLARCQVVQPHNLPVECNNVHFNKLPSVNWPGIAPAFFFEGIDGPAGLSGAERENAPGPVFAES